MTNLLEILKSDIPKTGWTHLPRSFDLIGDICIVEIKDEVKKYGKKIADALMKLHKNIKIVAKKAGAMHGKFRVRRLKVIAGAIGKRKLETIYKEHGCVMKLDVAKVYFSVRLSHERERIAAMVKEEENVLVMFAGVGPFALVIAKKRPTADVIGIEINPTAVKYFEENIRLNKLANCTAIKGDVCKVISKRGTGNQKLIGWADRILMPLPKSAEDFLDVAFRAAKNNAIVHFYNFGAEESVFHETEDKIYSAAGKANVTIKILNEKIVRPYAPHITQVCVDFKIRKQV